MGYLEFGRAFPLIFWAIITGLIVFRILNRALDRLLSFISGAEQIMRSIFCICLNSLKGMRACGSGTREIKNVDISASHSRKTCLLHVRISAVVAELVDAQRWGRCSLTGVEVRVFSAAPFSDFLVLLYKRPIPNSLGQSSNSPHWNRARVIRHLTGNQSLLQK